MIDKNILRVKERISLLCSRINRNPADITLVAVSKGRTPDQIKEVIVAGISDIGENRVQEAMVKYESLQLRAYSLGLKWHMVGHLQTNKVKEAVKIFDLIQSVDSLRLAAEIGRHAARVGKVQDILIQVNSSGELNKSGLKPDETIEVIKKINELKNINIKGLMTIAPMVDNPEKSRPYFRMLKELRDKINNLQLTAYSLQFLSMGMSDDFEVAIEEGSNMLRLGRIIFEG